MGVECFELTPGPTAPTFRFSAYEADDADSAFFCDGFRCRGASEGLPEGATDDPKGSTPSAAPVVAHLAVVGFAQQIEFRLAETQIC